MVQILDNNRKERENFQNVLMVYANNIKMDLKTSRKLRYGDG
jgi:hypothetical protein